MVERQDMAQATEFTGPPGRRDIRGLKASKKLRGCAVIDVDGSDWLRQRSWPREIAVEFLSVEPHAQGGTLAWLVPPEALWPHPPKQMGIEGGAGVPPGPGQGLPLEQVARELADVLTGHRVYADAHLVVRGWLAALFASTSLGAPPFIVHDFYNLAHRTHPTHDDTLEAGRAAHHAAEGAWRAADMAIRHATFIRTLAARADARARPPTEGAGPETGDAATT
jgi:hypothetical protein